MAESVDAVDSKSTLGNKVSVRVRSPAMITECFVNHETFGFFILTFFEVGYMAIFNIHCDDPWFSYIRQGIKPVEGRKSTHTYKKIKVGDQIKFSNGKESFVANVTEIREYSTIEQYLEDVTLEKALPGVKSIEEGLNIYYEWTPEEKIRQYGFLGLFIKPV